ncbi:hypothetical protein [Wukongibacter baidiensis]
MGLNAFRELAPHHNSKILLFIAYISSSEVNSTEEKGFTGLIQICCKHETLGDI